MYNSQVVRVDTPMGFEEPRIDILIAEGSEPIFSPGQVTPLEAINEQLHFYRRLASNQFAKGEYYEAKCSMDKVVELAKEMLSFTCAKPEGPAMAELIDERVAKAVESRGARFPALAHRR